MAMLELVFCLLPSLVLLLVVALLQVPAVRICGKALVERTVCWLWDWTCWCLGLPLTPGGSEPGPQIVGKPTALARYLLQNCATLTQPGTDGWPRGNPHFQTLFSLAGLLDNEEIGVRFNRDHLQMRDGGVVALDWAVGVRGARRQGPRKELTVGERVLGCHTPCPPVLILIPNSWGRLTPHLVQLCVLALHQGYCPVVFHRRGQGGCPLVTPRFQEFGDPSDLVQAISYLRSRQPSSTLLAVSEGSGSGLLLSYLGEYGSSSYLTAAACLSPVLRGQLWFETPLHPLYRWGILLYRKLQLSRYASALSGAMNVEGLLHCVSLRDMEELMFCQDKAEGRKDQTVAAGEWEAYWERNEPLRDADEVAAPVLCLCSRDDPLLPPASTMPLSLFRNSTYFLLALMGHGGHCGFMPERGGTGDRATCWSHRVVLEYFQVVAEFLRAEERNARGALAVGGEPRCRTDAIPLRRRRATLLRRDRPPARISNQTKRAVDGDFFTWHRSYTR